jgi:hypothetical protein
MARRYRGNRIPQRGNIPVNPGAAAGRITCLLDVKGVRTVFGALELVEIFKILFHESDPMGLARLALEGVAFPCPAWTRKLRIGRRLSSSFTGVVESRCVHLAGTPARGQPLRLERELLSI